MIITTTDVTSLYAIAYGLWVYETLFYIALFSGILLFPLLLKAYYDSRAAHDMTDKSEQASTESRRQFWSWAEAIIILPLCVIPWQPVEFANLQLASRCSSETSSLGETNTTADSPFSVIFGDDDEIKAPPALIAILSIAQGFSYTAQNTLPCVTDMVAIDYSLRNITLAQPQELEGIADPGGMRETDFNPPPAGSNFCQGGPGYTCYSDQALLGELSEFEQYCYRPALDRMERALAGEYGGGTRQAINDAMNAQIDAWSDQGIDATVELHYVGNRLFLNTPGLYLPCEGDNCPGNGENRAPLPRGEFGEIPPNCADWWAGDNGLRQRLSSQLVVMHLGAENLPPAVAEDYLRAIQITGYVNGSDVDGWANSDTPDEVLEDVAIKIFVQNLPPSGVPSYNEQPGILSRAASAIYDRTILAGAQRIAGVSEQAGTGIIAALTLPEYISQQAELMVIRRVAPLLLGLVMMVVVAGALIFHIISQFSLASALKLYIFICALAAIPIFWEIAMLIDSALYISINPDSYQWGVRDVVDRAIFDWTAAVFYLIAPVIFLTLVNLGGWRTIDSLSATIGADRAAKLGRSSTDVVRRKIGA